MIRTWPVALVLVASLAGQTVASRPKFEDYSVKQIFHGTPAVPVLSKDQRIFRTRIRKGAKSPVEFAGHFTVPRFGCGTGCTSFYFVDSVNGKVYDFDFSVSELPGKWLEEQQSDEPDRIEFHANSRLFKINGCLNEKDCGFYDYIMVDGKGLRLVYKRLLPTEYE